MKLNSVLLGIIATSCLNSVVHADFVKDTTANLYLKNFYFDRNFDDANSKDLSNWSQAATLTINSGYTDTPLQLGLDLSARYAYRLSSAKNIVDNVMPYDASKQQQAQDQLKLGATAKFKYSDTELKIGEVIPKLPIVHTDVAMQLPTTFLGGILESKDFANTKITAGRLTKVSGRNAEDYYKFQLTNGKNKAQSDALDFVGLDYDFNDQQIRYFYAKLEDIYDQHFLSYEFRHNFNATIHLKSNFYLFDTKESGDALEGKLDNQVYATIHMLNYGNHTFGLGYKYVGGDNAFPLLANWVPQVYSANWSVGTFMQQDERSWQVRYDYDFKDTPLNGLKSIIRYYDGDHIKTNTGNNGTEKEFDLILNYDFQQLQLKGLGISWLYADYKNSVSKDYIENRLGLYYTYKF
ncbi:outer membrane porin, OprD family [Acinetobacter sp. S40]|uniref:OprD family outer membrane porin n=1 Tax=unclassified Acinetobacter TaxID=196816 RepID=UPI001909F767|nr:MULTISPECIES: OprD family outer membrane porin [unclassified Acinetobacter]MBJ9984685.1 outer membrane porin, OprD family [Acinetobacter sp. S40]MBK0062450.1 outer membrane porin, OprD family [Acinetobacter sp. S55]MBK0066254.1 outer membrane porin, OprD family [Acinetobacter sp. S54]